MTEINNHFFVIIAMPRSGSNYLCSLLASHPLIVCHNEVFHPNEVGAYLPKEVATHNIFDVQTRDNNPRIFIERLLHESHRYYRGKTEIGCKLLINTPQMDRGLDALLDFNPKVILLDRRDKLAVFSSIQIATKNGIWLSKNRPRIQEKIIFDPKEYEFRTKYLLEHYDRGLKAVEHRKLPLLRMDYEELLLPKTTAEILNFLSVRAHPLVAETAQINTENILERFSNPEDVQRYFKWEN